MLSSVIVGIIAGMDVYCVEKKEQIYDKIKKQLKEEGYTIDESVPCEFLKNQRKKAYIPILNLIDLYWQSKSEKKGLLEGIYRKELRKCGMIEKSDNGSEIKGIKPYGEIELNDNNTEPMEKLEEITKTSRVESHTPTYPSYYREFVLFLPNGTVKHITANEDQLTKFINKCNGLKPEVAQEIQYMQHGDEYDKTYIRFSNSIDPEIVQALVECLEQFENMIDHDGYTIS